MEPNKQNTFLIPFAIIVAGGFVAAAVYFGTGSSSPTTAINTDNQSAEIDLAPVTEKDHIIGSRDAALVIVEYSDTECPFCKTFQNTMKEIVQTYEGEVAWVYRHFPIAQLHTKAAKESEATECAAELGGNQAFWKYIDKVFETTSSNDSLDPSELPKIATAIGLDVNAFNTCLSSGKYTELVKKSVEEAIKAGALGTPYSVIVTKDGQKVLINGAEPIAMVKAKIDALLK
ncbi:MAG: DsbA family protein [bacterium]|nr:DsbA family protein [bacterium]